MAQGQQSYSIGIFTHQRSARDYECAVCMGIMDKTTTSGCDEGHEFCESCIRRHFNSGKTICPVCRQPGLSVNTMHRSKATDRRINNLEVKCKLSLNTEPREEKGPSSQKEEKEEIIDCDWTGPLSNLSDHMNHHCPLFPMECPDCDFQCLRHEMDQHNAECPEKKVECELGYAQIQRKLMKVHMEKHCGRFPIGCPHCGTEIERERLPDHINNECPDVVIDCDYKTFGCSETFKRKDREFHLEDIAVKLKHTEMKLEHNQIELQNNRTELKILKERLKPYTYRNELVIISSNNNRAVFKCNLDPSKQAQSLPEAPRQYLHHVVGRELPYHSALKMGLNPEDISPFFPNTILFAHNSRHIGVYFTDSAKWKEYHGDLKWINGPLVVSRHHGYLLKVGCVERSISDPNARTGGHIVKIKFNNQDDSFHVDDMPRMTYSGKWVGALCFTAVEEKLFVCGGYWNNKNLNNAEIHHLANGTVMKLKPMLHAHQVPGVARWDNNGDKIVVAGGSDRRLPNDIQFVEEYDLVKDKWIDLPKLNGKHDRYPGLWSSNGVLICCGTEENDPPTRHCRLGSIEMYDPRDCSNQWRKVDTVQRYFGLDQNQLYGFNNILPL